MHVSELTMHIRAASRMREFCDVSHDRSNCMTARVCPCHSSCITALSDGRDVSLVKGCLCARDDTQRRRARQSRKRRMHYMS